MSKRPPIPISSKVYYRDREITRILRRWLDVPSLYWTTGLQGPGMPFSNCNRLRHLFERRQDAA